MKKQALKVFTFLSLFVALTLAMPAYSQNKNFTVKIPFQFYIDDKALPPGIYTIGPAFQSDWKGLTIRSQEGGINVTFMTTTVQSGENPYVIKLVFNKYGERYFLSQFYKSRERTGRELTKSRAERELSERGLKPETVALASK